MTESKDKINVVKKKININLVDVRSMGGNMKRVAFELGNEIEKVWIVMRSNSSRISLNRLYKE